MRAMVLRDPKQIEREPLVEEEVRRPEPGPGQIRIDVSVCGVCHTDLHTVEGDLPLPVKPIIPGHQIVGTVEKRGEGADRFEIGDRIGVPWLYDACGRCELCASGRENLCREARFTGLHANGGYAESMVVGERYAYPIPDVFDDARAAPLLCAGIIGYRALRVSRIGRGERLGIYGFGGSAHVTIQVARHWGCEVYVFTRSGGHRNLAKRLGAAWVGGAEDTPPERVQGSIIFAPAGRLVPEALRVLERGGTVALAGVTMSQIPEIDYDELLYWERGIRSVANFTRRDAEELLATAREIPIETTVSTFPLDQANDVLKDLKESRIDGTAVLTVASP